MTTAQAVGAVSREAAEWYAIDWQTCRSPKPREAVNRARVTLLQAVGAAHPSITVLVSRRFNSSDADIIEVLKFYSDCMAPSGCPK